MSKTLLTDVDVLKIDVPGEATLLTEFKITRLAKVGYYSKAIESPTVTSRIGDGKTVININGAELDPESDIYAFAIDKFVSVTPLSVDLTSRVQLSELQRLFNK